MRRFNEWDHVDFHKYTFSELEAILNSANMSAENKRRAQSALNEKLHERYSIASRVKA